MHSRHENTPETARRLDAGSDGAQQDHDDFCAGTRAGVVGRVAAARAGSVQQVRSERKTFYAERTVVYPAGEPAPGYMGSGAGRIS